MTLKKATTLALSLACAVTTGFGVASLNLASADSSVTFVYGARAFSATEDYNYLTDYAYANETSLSDGEKTRTGTLMKATKTGASAEGSSFNIKETQTDDFSMEFRVFSRSTYKQSSYGQTTHYGNASAIANDLFNPFLDLKEVQFTFTSVSNPTQSFTVYFNGATSYFAYRTNVRASVNGGAKSSEVVLTSTSFSNLDWYQGVAYNTVPNTVNFDVETGAITANNQAVYTLGASDLANYTSGYNVKITYADVTANDVTGNELALAWNTYEQTGDGYSGPLSDTFTNLSADVSGKDVRYSATVNGGTFSEKFTGYNASTGRYIGDLGYDEGVGTAYEREAQMLVYSVNGVSTFDFETIKGSTLTYNIRDISATQDYNYLTDYEYSNEATISSAEKDLTGALMKATKTGLEAEGAGFDVKETQTSDFSMDFRVFSKTTYKYNGYGTATHWAYGFDAYCADEYNPFLDLKEVQFTFTSVSDSTKSQTLCVRGITDYFAYQTSAYMKGETAFKGIAGTSFSNLKPKDYDADPQVTTNYQSVTFNKTSGVIAVNGVVIKTLNASELADYADGYKVTVTYSDVTANTSTGNELAQAFTLAEQQGGLSPTNSSMSFTYLTGATTYQYHESFSAYSDWASCYQGNVGYDEGVGTAYEREAQMLVYGINGMPVETESWSIGELKDATGAGLITADNAKLTVTDNQVNGLDSRKGLLITSAGKSSGASAENASFSFNSAMAGEFDLDFRINSAQTYQAKLGDWSCAGFSTTDNWNYYFEDLYNPYADVKEVAFTFTSVTDTSKWFTVYMHRGAVGLGVNEAYTVSARVQTSGDSYYLESPSGDKYYGYGLNAKKGTCENVLKDYTAIPNTSFSNYAVTKPGANWAYPTPHASNLRFDPVAMKVYARGADITDLYTDRTQTKDYLIRDLTNNDNVTWADTKYKNEVLSTLSANDFAGGYTVSVAFTKLTDNATIANGGDVPELSYDTTNGYKGFDTAYARNINMTIYALNGQELYFENNQTGKIWDSTAPNVVSKTTLGMLNEVLDVSPICYDVLDGDNVTAGNVYVSVNGGAYQALTAVNGKFTYTPTSYDDIIVKYEGFADSVGNTKVQYSTVKVQDLIVPTLAFKENVIFRYDFTDGKSAKPSISLYDDVYLTNPIDIKTYRYEIESITLPNGLITKVTKLNYLDAGEYVVVYKATDNFGNVGRLTRTIVVGDFSAPVIGTPEEWTCNFGERINLMPTLSDYDSQATLQIIVKKDGVQVFKGAEFKAGEAGEYTVCYKAVDASGNVSEKEVVLKVVDANATVEPVQTGMATSTIIAIALFAVAGIGVISAVVIGATGGKEDEE